MTEGNSLHALPHTISQLIHQRNRKEKQNFPLIFDSFRNLEKIVESNTELAERDGFSGEIEQYLSSQIVDLKNKLRNATDFQLQWMKEKSYFVDSILEVTKQIHECESRWKVEALQNNEKTKQMEEMKIEIEKLKQENRQYKEDLENRNTELSKLDTTNENLSQMLRDLQDQVDVYRWKLRNASNENAGASELFSSITIQNTPAWNRSRASSLSRSRNGSTMSLSNSEILHSSSNETLSSSLRNSLIGKDFDDSFLKSQGSESSSPLGSSYNSEALLQEDIMQPMLEEKENHEIEPPLYIELSTSILQLQHIHSDCLIMSHNHPSSFNIVNNSNQHHVFYQNLSVTKETLQDGEEREFVEFETPLLISESDQKITCVHPIDSFVGSSPRIHSSLARNPNTSLLAISGEDACIRIVPISENMSDESRSILRRHTAKVNALTDCNLSTMLLSGSDDKSINVWDVPTYKLVRTYSNHAPITQLASVPQKVCPPLFVSWTSDQFLKFYDIRIDNSVLNISSNDITQGEPIMNLKCSDRYLVSATKDKVFIFDYRSMSQGPMRMVDMSAFHDVDIGDTNNEKANQIGVEVSPCYNYIATFNHKSINFFSLIKGDIVHQVNIADVMPYTMRTDSSFIQSLVWREKYLFALRSDNYIETIDVRTL